MSNITIEEQLEDFYYNSLSSKTTDELLDIYVPAIDDYGNLKDNLRAKIAREIFENRKQLEAIQEYNPSKCSRLFDRFLSFIGIYN